jgi:phosphoribosyl-dephospho-CoA transferase
MALKPHDLLEINSAEDLISHDALPEWAKSSLDAAPFVVVRRARAGPGFVAVGIRGFKRSERFAAFLPIDCIKRRITPEDLAKEQKWRKQGKEIFFHLEEIAFLMNRHSLEWGIAGSVGFELASGIEVTSKNSDIDLVIRFHHHFTAKLAREIKSNLDKMKVHVDVQVEAEMGAFSLIEYADCGESPILLRTMDGPIFKKI